MLFQGRHKIKAEVLKFFIVAVINTVITFSLFIILVNFLEFNYVFSLTLTWIISIIFTYFLNFLWVFRPETAIQFRRRFVKYASSYIFSYLFNLSLLAILQSYTSLNVIYAQAVLALVIGTLNFTLTKYWSLR
jgi:putative flippase GtrA